MDFIEKWKMKLFGRGVQTFKIEEIDGNGRVLTLRDVGKTKRRANTIIETWDNKGDEIHANPINFISSDHIMQPAFISQGGQTVDLYITPSVFPNREDIVGKLANMDDLTDALDLGKSVKNYILGALFSAPVWWLIFKSFGVIFS